MDEKIDETMTPADQPDLPEAPPLTKEQRLAEWPPSATLPEELVEQRIKDMPPGDFGWVSDVYVVVLEDRRVYLLGNAPVSKFSHHGGYDLIWVSRDETDGGYCLKIRQNQRLPVEQFPEASYSRYGSYNAVIPVAKIEIA